MIRPPPLLISLNQDDYHARHVGHTADRRQFFQTNPFVPAIGSDPGREFSALYLFDRQGRFLEAIVDDLGTRDTLDRDHARSLSARRLEEIGPVEFGGIEIQPFQFERLGTVFGLVPHPPEENEEEEEWWVTVEPGNYMAFHEPWDSGEYDT